MTEDERDEMLRQVHQAVLGIPGTDDKGMIGLLKQVCSDHARLKGTVYALIWFLTGTGILAGAGYGIDKLLIH